MGLQTVEKIAFDFSSSRPLEIEVSDSPLSSDAGLLPVAQFDEQIGLTAAFASAMLDPRDPVYVRHSLPSMAKQRIFGIVADYGDQNDQDTLRADPLFKLIDGRLPTE